MPLDVHNAGPGRTSPGMRTASVNGNMDEYDCRSDRGGSAGGQLMDLCAFQREVLYQGVHPAGGGSVSSRGV